MSRPFRFGSGFTGRAYSTPDEIRQRARVAESLGYSTVLVPDHVQEQLAPVPALLFIAEATTTLRVGTYVLVNDFRHPAVLAREFATIDFLSGGRLEMGLGAGWVDGDYATTGITMMPTGVRIERLKEATHLIKALFEQPVVDFDGAHYRTTGLSNHPEPAQSPRPPLLIGGGGRRILSLAAREADIVSIGVRTPSYTSIDWRSITTAATIEKLQWVRAAAGDRFDQLELNTYPAFAPVMVTDNARHEAALVADRLRANWPEFDLTESEFLESPQVLIGSVQHLVEKLLWAREELGITYLFVPDANLEAFAPVVQRLSGQ